LSSTLPVAPSGNRPAHPRPLTCIQPKESLDLL
jgi:hypothetical protein